MFRIDTTWMDEDMDDWVSSTNVSLQVRHRVVTTRPSPWLTIHKARFLAGHVRLAWHVGYYAGAYLRRPMRTRKCTL